ncbi:MAG: ACT domain-containing protein [Coriobacteriia bacterium]|nr:ACT domain-containing protein [Coriobacteriia bacterium]
MVNQVSVFLENTSGRLAELTRTLGDAGINMHALMVADTSDFGVVRIICDSPQRAKDLLDAKGFGASLTPVVAVEVPDRPGGLADLLEALGEEGMNVEYAYCFVRPTASSAVDVFRVDDDRAQAVLEAAGFSVLSASDLYDV